MNEAHYFLFATFFLLFHSLAIAAPSITTSRPVPTVEPKLNCKITSDCATLDNCLDGCRLDHFECDQNTELCVETEEPVQCCHDSLKKKPICIPVPKGNNRCGDISDIDKDSPVVVF